MPAKAGTQGQPILRLRPWAPACAGATRNRRLGVICLVGTKWPGRDNLRQASGTSCYTLIEEASVVT